MRRKKEKSSFYKIIVYLLLILIAIGFTVPTFFDSDEEENVQKRICRYDSDCYLTCENTPSAVMCYNNFCQRDSCNQKSIFPYLAHNIKAELKIKIAGEKVNLTYLVNPNNFFIQFKEDSFTLFAPNLTINHVLDKLGMKLISNCLQTKEKTYCSDNNNQLIFKVNNQTAYSEQIVKEGDKIIINYS